MKKMKRQRKGFTLTELAIVIAVIAILIAVLVPTFISLINKANESSDKQLVKNLNTALSISDEAETMSDALIAAEDNGYKVENLTPTSEGYDIIWDQVENQFLLIEGSTILYPFEGTLETSNSYRYWYIVNSTSDYTKYSANTCSLYINTKIDNVESKGGIEYASSITSTATVVSTTSTNTASSSIENKALASTAIKTTGNTSSIPQVIIITNGGTLSVTVEGNAEVNHSGSSSTVTVVKANNYVVNASVTELSVTNGNITISSIATVNTITASSSISINIETGASVQYIVGGATPTGNTSSVNVLNTASSTLTYKESSSMYYVTSSYVKLESATTISVGLVIGSVDEYAENVLLDLNGYTLNLNSYIFIKDEGSLTICDSSENGTGKIVTGSTHSFGFEIKDNGSLTLNSGTIYSENVYPYHTILIVAYGEGNTASFIMNGGSIECVANGMYNNTNYSYGPEAIFLMPADYSDTSADYTKANAYAEINGGTITTQGYFCISTNGQSTQGVENIIINGGTLTAYNSNVMYLPANGTTTINGGILQSICGANINSDNSYGCGDGIDASYDAIEIKSGTLYITGGTIYTNAAYSDKALTPSGDGTTPAGAALNICSKKNYSGNIVVIISGGTFTSINGSSINIGFAAQTTTDYVRSVAINGGTYSYNSNYYAVQCTINGANVSVSSNLNLITYGI